VEMVKQLCCCPLGHRGMRAVETAHGLIAVMARHGMIKPCGRYFGVAATWAPTCSVTPSVRTISINPSRRENVVGLGRALWMLPRWMRSPLPAIMNRRGVLGAIIASLFVGGDAPTLGGLIAF
jgi:hypothetical protein